MSGLVKGISRLDISRASLFVCDLQDKFRPLIYNMETAINRSALCINIAKVLSLPVVTTQQYTKVFGPTVEDLAVLLPNEPPVFEKTRFSMLTPEVQVHCDTLGLDQVIICGIEAHVCVLHTVLDLLAQGKEVHVVVDAVSSQRKQDRDVALGRMLAAGAVITTSESAMFDLLRDAQHPHFKACSALLKTHNERCTWSD
eukprot:GSChrysophyteH1.ASY1.ANO1.1475.1 assembled CDS